MAKYESMYILKPDLEDEAKDALVAKFQDIVKNGGGEIEKVDEWGKRKLAYPINYIGEGYYVLMYFSAPAELPAELERNYRITDEVMRFIVINLDNE